jgi:cysteine-S-conjugate beta-lyase
MPKQVRHDLLTLPRNTKLYRSDLSMRKYNFDEIIDRSGTNSIKYDALSHFFGTNDVLPVWVADTDFRTPDFIIEAIRNRMEHEILAYTFRGDSFHNSITGWLLRRYNWEINKKMISFSPGVVSAITVAILVFTRPGDKVIVQPPVYFPFFSCISGTNRQIVENPLKLVQNRYYFDLEDLKRKIDRDTKMLILCSPHNPGGMVWKRDELEELEEICAFYNLMVVSDEIHSDLLFSGQTHTPWAKISERSSQNCMVCMAPSKTFNVAGLSTSFAVIPNLVFKKLFDKMMETLHIQTGNIPGAVALEAAYTYGEEWLSQLMEYVEGNFQFLERFFADHLPEVKVMRPEATFLVWLDFSEYGMNDNQLSRFLIEKAKVGLNNGARFGTGGEGFQRINIGCPRSVLEESLSRIYKAFNNV